MATLHILKPSGENKSQFVKVTYCHDCAACSKMLNHLVCTYWSEPNDQFPIVKENDFCSRAVPKE